MQQASIVGNLEKFGVLKNSLGRKPSKCGEQVEGKEEGVSTVIEYGAGRGYLTQMLADCYGINRVFLVERKAYKLKVGDIPELFELAVIFNLLFINYLRYPMLFLG
jgi:tRNA:m4X modification enzyme